MTPTEVTASKLLNIIPDHIQDLFSNAEYPWEALDRIGEYIASIYDDMICTISACFLISSITCCDIILILYYILHFSSKYLPTSSSNQHQ